MNWEELTARNFADAVKKSSGVCLIPLGCIEKHGDHLPLGTDIIKIRHIAKLTAEIEPVVIFPSYYFTQIAEAKHVPGTISLDQHLIISLLEKSLDEVSRNGMKKIVLLNGHGGNTDFLNYFTKVLLDKRRDYTLYIIMRPYGDEDTKQLMETKNLDEHGGEMETSMMLSIAPEMVKMEDISPNPATKLNRAPIINGPEINGLLRWYANYPEHYAGDGRCATAEKGTLMIKQAAEKTARLLKRIKEDTVVEKLQNEYFNLSESPLENCKILK